MQRTTLRVGLIGAGRAGTVIARALERVGHHCVAVNAVSEASRSRAARMLPSAEVLDAIAVCAASDLVILAVPDDVIGGLVAGLVASGAITQRHLVMHLSGRHGTAILEPATAVGATALAVHPAMTLHGVPEEVARLEHCPFAVTATGDALAIGFSLVYELGGIPAEVAEEDRVRYHAALAHASNHLVTIVAQAMEVLASLGFPRPGDYVRPLVEASLEGVLRDGDAALTGPIARGDLETVRAHLAALTSAPGVPSSTVDAYRAIATATAARRGMEAP